jgi:hypothetical protein
MGRVKITPDDRSALVRILIWFNFIVAALIVLVRSVIKIWVLKHFNLDDSAIILSLVRAESMTST